jgi:uncharacterized protein
MEWEQFRESSNVEDRRGDGGGGGFPIGGGGGLGIGAILILAVIGYFTGIDPRLLIGGAQVLTGANNGTAYHAPAQNARAAPDDQTEQFVRKIVGGTEDVWAKVLPAQKGINYRTAKVVTYSGVTNSACGTAQKAMGPFYCPEDKTVYLDTSFFNDMKAKYGGGGDFAYAYVIAHEIGHHVQDLMGILGKVDQAKQQLSRTQANALSVRVELMADCLAGVWAYNANQQYQRKVIDDNDIQRAMATASAIGDDRLQTAARGYAVPDSFTHGSSAMRQKWLQTGLDSGQVDSCNTFRQ